MCTTKRLFFFKNSPVGVIVLLKFILVRDLVKLKVINLEVLVNVLVRVIGGIKVLGGINVLGIVVPHTLLWDWCQRLWCGDRCFRFSLKQLGY